MSNQTQADDVNKFARKVLGPAADAAAAALNPLTVLPGGKDGEGEGKPEAHWVRLPTTNWRPSQFAREVGLIMASEEMFQRDGVAVMVDQETGQLTGVTSQKLITELERWFVFYQLKVKDEEPAKLPMGMKVDTARMLLEASEFVYRLRKIIRVNKVRMPVMRRNGKPELLPEGYDEESRIYTLKSGLTIDEEMPLEKAKAVLEFRLKDFRFEDERSKRVQLCLMVSLFGTCMLPLEAARMGNVTRSNDRGGGKSLLTQMAIIAPFGLPATADIKDRNKLGETFDSAALQSEAYIFFDNLEGVVKNPLIDNFLTAPSRRVRLFHTQKTVEAVPGTVLLFTGNNLDVSPDIERRTLLCRIFVEEFDLMDRHFESVLNVTKLMKPAVRQEMLGAMWALIRHWGAMGCPCAGEPGKPYRRPSFEDWSDLFGGIIQAAGYGNPLVPPSDEMSAGQERKDQRRLVELLADKIDVQGGKTRVAIREFQDVVDVCYEAQLFEWKLMDGGKVNEQFNSVGEKTSTQFKASPTALAWLGRFMSQTVCGREAGREYTLSDKRRVRIGFAGKGRSRTYWVELVG
jgi:hypothetical protein